MHKEISPRVFDISANAFASPYGSPFVKEDLLPRPNAPSLAPRKILLVDPVPAFVRDTENILRLLAHVDVCVDYGAARDRLVSSPPDLLIANIRLREYNALHLVLRALPQTRCIVYAAHHDPLLAREAQAAGAFYERSIRLAPA